MKAKLVYENINFDRGKNPRTTMGIGNIVEVPKKIYDIYRNKEDVYAIWTTNYLSDEDNTMVFGTAEGKREFNKYLIKNGYDQYLEMPGKVLSRRKTSNRIGYHIKPEYQEILKDFSSYEYGISLKESINFERGKDPKKAMGIGGSWETLSSGDIIELKNDFPNIGKYKGDLFKIIAVENDPENKKFIKYERIDKDGNPTGERKSSWTLSKNWFNENFKFRYLNENVNFERGKTPKETMNVGRESMIKKRFLTYEDAADWAIRNLELITDNKYSPNDVIRKSGGHLMPKDLADYLKFWVEKVDLTGYYNPGNLPFENRILQNAGLLREIGKQMKKHGILIENINFERGKDPGKSMRIGARELIKKWFDTWDPEAVYEIDDDLNIKVFGSLDLEGSQIAELPGNLNINGYLDLRGSQITKLPDSLSVRGFLDLRNTSINKLPDNLMVGGDLYLGGTYITELPDNLIVGGDLDLEGSQITKLPDSLSVEGSIYEDF